MDDRAAADEHEFALRLAEYDELRANRAADSPDDAVPAAGQPNDIRWDRSVRLLRQLDEIHKWTTHSADAGTSAQQPQTIGSQNRLGRFEIIRELGQGGGGIVFLARDSELDRPVALKIPRLDGLFSNDVRRRFLDEARAAARLRHPNVAAIHDAGTQGAVCWYAAEYCSGISLRDYLYANPNSISTRQAIALVATIADAVRYAHDNGVVHRDLKPSNVLMTSREESGDRELGAELLPSACLSRTKAGEGSIDRFVPKLIDFGLAKLVDDPGSATLTDVALGTPSYMAPEQVHRKYGMTGPAIDIYGLGAILYELVTGVPPFRGESHAEIFIQLTTQEPIRPSTLRRGLSADVEAIVLRCLEKDPQRRYASAGELADDLQRVLCGEPTHARPLGPMRRFAKWSKRHPAVVAICGIIVAALAIMAGGGFWHIVRLEHALAINERLRAEGLAREQTLIRDQYVVDMQLASRAWASGRLLPVLDYVNKYVPRRGEFDPRDFAWRHLDRLAHRDTLVLRGHEKTVLDAVFSPDETRIATTGLDATVRIYDGVSGKQLSVIRGHDGCVRGVTFVNDGKHLLTAGEDGFLKLWSVADATPVASQQVCTDELLCVALHPDGTRVAVAGSDGVVRLWSTMPLAMQSELQHHTSSVFRLAFSRQGEKLVSTDEEGIVQCWNCERGLLGWSTKTPIGVATALAIHPDGEIVVAGGDADCVALLSMKDGQLLRCRENVIHKTYGLAFTRDPLRLLAVGNWPELMILDATTQRLPTTAHLPLHTSGVRSLRISADERLCLTASADGTARVWPNTAEPGRASLGRMKDHSAQSVAVSRDGRTIVAGCVLPDGSSTARVWESPSHKPLGDLPDAGPCVAITQDGHMVATDHRLVTLRHWNLNRMQCDGDIGTTRVPIRGLAVDPHHRLVAAACDASLVELFDYEQRKKVAEFTTHRKNDLDAVTFSPEGTLLAATDDVAREAVIWEIATGREVARLPCRGIHASFSPDGKWLATAGDVDDDTTVLVFDTATWQLRRRLTTDLKKPMTQTAFSPHGRVLASISDRGAAQLWDVKTGVQMLRLGTDLDELRSVQFFPDGQNLLVSAKHRDGDCELIILEGGELRFRE